MIANLPDDLELEILSRVPAKSLWELKTTCKRWYAQFRDPRFVEKNNRLGKAARESMLLSKHEVYSISRDLHSSSGFDTPIIQLTGKLRNLKGSKDLNYFSHLFHCDGLMLCSTEWNTRLVVWNPCTGQRRKIKPRARYRSEDEYALGYTTSSSSGRSYKILKYLFYRNNQKLWVADCEIYELASGSWRVLDSFTLDYDLFFNGMSLKGDTYWVAGHESEGTDFFLMKFDFTAERFVRLPLPFRSSNILDTKLLSVVRDEKLSVLHIDDVTDVMRIWVTNKIDDEEDAKDLSWRSDLVLKLDSAKFNLSVENFLLDEENKVAVCCDKFTSDGDRTMVYIVGEDLFKQVYEDTRDASPVNWPVVLTYVPSLVCIN